MVQGVPVGIVLAVVRSVVPHLAVGEGGVVHLIDYGQTQLDVGSNVGNLVVRHAVALQLQQTAGTVIYRLVPKAVDDSQPSVALEDETVIA